ncbi:MAG: Clo7bot family Cys-rich peptide [Clostridia bacterium]|nr:Clo7bot family Cys-rich peptide [Clostridia bacterium]
MKYLVNPVKDFVEGYCYICGTQCNNKCGEQCIKN